MDHTNIKTRSFGCYEKEYVDSLNQLYSENAELPGFRWFLDTAYAWAFGEQDRKREVVLLGTMIPEEIVIAAGAKPRWLIGGSLGTAAWSDDLVPRDADPVSRSILGYLHRPGAAPGPEALYIVPLVNDSMRKIAYELKSQGRKLCLIDVPPDRKDRYAEEKYARQMKELCAAVSRHTGTRVTKNTAVSAMRRVSAARTALQKFLEQSRGRAELISDAARLLVHNSYYLADSIDEWTRRVEALSRELAGRALCQNRKTGSPPAVLLAGSPVRFPNYKVPFLVRDAGLAVADCVDEAALKPCISYKRSSLRGSRDQLIQMIAAKWFRHDASSANIRNDVMFEMVERIAKQGSVEGVVWHVLKGQMEYDFELDRIEPMLSGYGIPVFRLETDYQYQDVEQLRIRLEAFSEMLEQNRYRRVARVS